MKLGKGLHVKFSYLCSMVRLIGAHALWWVGRSHIISSAHSFIRFIKLFTLWKFECLWPWQKKIICFEKDHVQQWLQLHDMLYRRLYNTKFEWWCICVIYPGRMITWNRPTTCIFNTKCIDFYECICYAQFLLVSLSFLLPPHGSTSFARLPPTIFN